MTRRPLILILLCAILLGWGASVFGQTGEIPKKYQQQIAYIYNIVQHTTLPRAKQPDPFVIGTYGKHPFQNGLETLEGRGLRDKRGIQVLHCAKPADLNRCHLVYIGPGAAGVNWELLHQNGIVTIVDNELLPKNEGILEFYVFRNKGRFRLDPKQMNTCKIKFGAPLMQVLRAW